MRGKSLITISLLLLSAALAAAQTTTVRAPGDMVTTQFVDESAPQNYVSFGGTFGMRYDDNAEPGGPDKVHDVTLNVAPRFAFQASRPRWDALVSYTPSWSFDQRLDAKDWFDQSVTAMFAVRPSPHWTLDFRNDYRVVTDTGGKTSADLPTDVGVGQPNEGVFFLSRREVESVSGQAVGQIREHTWIGMTGSYAFVNFREAPPNLISTGLIDSQVIAGRAFVTQQVRPRHSLGFMYQVQDLELEHTVTSSALTHDFFATYTFDVTPNQQLQLYGGPEYTNLDDQLLIDFGGLLVLKVPVKTSFWSGAGGATYTWTVNRTRIRGNFLRAINDGGGITGASRLHQASLDVRQKLSRRWEALGGFAFNDTSTLFISNPQTVQSEAFTIGISNRLTRNLRWEAHYQFIHQTENNIAPLLENHNRLFFRLDFEMKKPLGL